MEASSQQESFCRVHWTHKMVLIQGTPSYRVPSTKERLLSAITRFFTRLVTLVLLLPALHVSVTALTRCIQMTEKSSEFTPSE